MIGFVLAVISTVTSWVVMYLIPLIMGWIHSQMVFSLDGLLLGFGVVLFLGVQGILLFGFPLHYAQDKKDNMTGFQIIVYELIWVTVIMAIATALSVALAQPAGNNMMYPTDFPVETQVTPQ